MEQYKHPFTAVIGEEARRKNMPNEMNYIMDYRLIHCLRNGLPLDQDVYDAAEWSCITELSERSVRQGSVPGGRFPISHEGTGKRDSAVSSLAQGG